ncbi:MAG: hypothetical protein V4722_00185 [Bacteroidota bacterium]
MKRKAFLFAMAAGIATVSFGQKVGIGVTIPTNTLEVLSSVNGSGTAAILGRNGGTVGSGIVGTSQLSGTYGVTGYSSNGFGVGGYTDNNIGVFGSTISGIGLFASSSTGYALQISGNLRFSGGNMNASDGGVLTSDADGDATWKPGRVGFLATGTLTTTMPSAVPRKIDFVDESYDAQDDFAIYSGTPTSNSSVFTAPVNGVYHFSSALQFTKAGVQSYFYSAQIQLVKNNFVIASSDATSMNYDGLTSFAYVKISGDFRLQANDRVWVVATQYNGGNTAEALNPDGRYSRFSGRLVKSD